MSRRGSGSFRGEDVGGSSGVYNGRREGVVREGEVREERERGVLRATFVVPFPFLYNVISDHIYLFA